MSLQGVVTCTRANGCNVCTCLGHRDYIRAHAYGHTEQCKDDKHTIKIKSWVLARLTGP